MIRLPHLNWPQRAAIAAALTIFALVGGMERSDALPILAHHPTTGFGVGHCLPTGVWQATLTVTADVPGGTATLQPPGVVSFDRAVPVSNVFTIGPNIETFTVVVTVTWPDGFKAPPVTETATRPTGGCTVPTTSTTTCTQANPPRTDCEVPTSPSPSTTTPPTSPTSLVPPAPSAPGNPPSTTTAPRPLASTSVTPTKPINLPATGTDGTPLALAAAGFGLVGVALVTTTRRRKQT